MYSLWFMNFQYPDHYNWFPGIYYEQFLYYALHIVIRSFIIAVRYAFCSELRYLMLTSASQNTQFICRDLFIVGWLSFHPT